MIKGLGIDAIEIDRFLQWHTFSKKQLARIFSPAEIAYCLANQTKSAERFAVRFATKEAFFKAWHSASPTTYVPFLTLCKAISLAHGDHDAPTLSITWGLLPPINHPLTSL